MENVDIVRKEYENQKLKKEDVKLLLEWADSQPHLPKFTEQEAIWFLSSCYYSNEQAKITVDNYFTMKTMSPEVLGNRDCNSAGLKKNIDILFISVLPKRTKENHAVLLIKLLDVRPEKFHYNEFVRLFDMMTLLDMYLKGTYEGFRCCLDMSPAALGHVARLPIVSVKKFLYYLQDGMPIRLKGLHFFNINSVMDKILMIIKPFMKKEILDVLHLHESVQDMDKYVPIELLPSDYGGKEESIMILKGKMDQDLKDNNKLFAYQDSQLVDESKRPGKPKSISDIYGVEGTFKKLDLD